MATRMLEVAAVDYSLPNECWETIFKFLINNDYGNVDDNNNHHIHSLSAVSKQFLSITNNLLFSLNVRTNFKPSVTIINCKPTVNINDFIRPSNFLSRLIRRFSNLNSLHLTGNNLNNTLCKISRLPFFTLKSLHLNFKLTHFRIEFPTEGLRLVSQNITTLTSLTFSHLRSLSSTYLLLIAECFPLLEQLNLNLNLNLDYHGRSHDSLLIEGVKALSSSLLKLRKVDLTNHYYINDQCLCYLFKNWKFLEEAIIIGCKHLTNNGITSALSERPTLRSFSFSGSSYFLLYAAKNSIACPQLTSLAFTSYKLSNRGIVGLLFASIFPNLQLLDFSACPDLYEDDICQVLTNCTEIRQLNLAKASRMKLRVMNFDVPNLEVLNLSHTEVDDEALYVISKSCRGLLKLLLEHCCHVTEEGLNYVVENCTQLREINLNGCQKVHANVIASMVLSRPSLRRIVAPQPDYCFSDTEMKLFLRRRCLVETALTNLKL
ncbi:F-box/LRR-repeat protein 3-like [Trifolium pratense]|uniref:Uncharacterized protein n=1 Tax=Trifolium pratense TaxID=57577 RepID=A0ACB0L9E4_TRIPR|nr:F-box/LRR-repeat protein 3-like [Trifolium pratense]CAJ2663962.1 unnamed protein product [Trifolium pratense]